ncbi:MULTISPECIES: hypothetical protein [unclassified Streptomyces]|uniref:hypothetical protein n=1 Tax=unclassified Streptomyces TaxID=2593676 RepID=UPI002E1841B5|nr:MULTISPECIES: hypothetical protein [unclassified Streptomyces]
MKNLIAALHELHLRAGRPTLSDLAKSLEGSVSRSRLHDAFTSGRLPRWEVVDALVETLGSRARGTTPEQELDRFHTLWQSAVSDGGSPEPESAPQAAPVRFSSLPRPRTPGVDEAARRREASEAGDSLYMPHALFERIRGRPWMERIEDGYLSFLTGDFRPPKPKGQLPTENMTVVFTRLDPRLRVAVADYAAEQARDLGWTPTPKQVAVAWLVNAYPPSAGKPAIAS